MNIVYYLTTGIILNAFTDLLCSQYIPAQSRLVHSRYYYYYQFFQRRVTQKAKWCVHVLDTHHATV